LVTQFQKPGRTIFRSHSPLRNSYLESGEGGRERRVGLSKIVRKPFVRLPRGERAKLPEVSFAPLEMDLALRGRGFAVESGEGDGLAKFAACGGNDIFGIFHEFWLFENCLTVKVPRGVNGGNGDFGRFW
jgi:hypothetical protein